MKGVLTKECGHPQAAKVRGSRAQTDPRDYALQGWFGASLIFVKGNFDFTHFPERAVADCYHGPSFLQVRKFAQDARPPPNGERKYDLSQNGYGKNF